MKETDGKQKDLDISRAKLLVIFCGLVSRLESAAFCQNNRLNLLRSSLVI